MKRILWYLIAGTKGGVNRARIIQSLHKRPYNANQLSELLDLDYKTIKHHIKVLKKNNLIIEEGDYGSVFFLVDVLENNFDVFEEIWEQVGDGKTEEDTKQEDEEMKEEEKKIKKEDEA